MNSEREDESSVTLATNPAGPVGGDRTPNPAWSAVLLALAGFPLLWLVGFYAFVLRARWALGHWPAPYRPDPAELGFKLHALTLQLALFVEPLILLAAVVLALVARYRDWVRRVWPAFALLAGSVLLTLALGRTDPGRFFEWFAD